MITFVLCATATVWIAGGVILAVSARRAPVGYEDDEGFHAVTQTSRSEPVYAVTAHTH